MKKLILFSFLLIASTHLFAQTKTYGMLKKVPGNDENGYVLFSSQGGDSTFLMDKCGQLVHVWGQKYTPAYSCYLLPNGNLLKTGIIKDPIYGLWAGRGGLVEEYDWDNNLVWRMPVINDTISQHHDIYPLPNGNILVIAWHSINRARAEALGRLPQYIPMDFGERSNQLWSERIIELKKIGKDSAEIVWEWDILDHIIQDVDSTLPNYGDVSLHPELMNINYGHQQNTADWLHANGIAYNADKDQIVLSCHNQSEIWVIDHSTTTQEAASHSGGAQNKGGDILYRWGNPAAYKQGHDSDRILFQQHNPHWIPNGYPDEGKIMIFNNGNGRDSDYSSVEVISVPDFNDPNYGVNLPYEPANSDWTYKDSVPTNFFSRIISGANRLPNGNTLICSGVEGKFFEVTPKGEKVWQYQNPVAGMNKRTDGSPLVNASVFRCEFYPSNYPAFTGKALTPMGPIERNSIPYTCNTEYIAPTLVRKIPLDNANGVMSTTEIALEFSEVILKRDTGNIVIYKDGILFDQLSFASPNIIVEGNFLYIRPSKEIPPNAHIAIAVSTKIVRDSSFNIYLPGIDSVDWQFNTITPTPIFRREYPANASFNVDPKTDLKIIFSEKVFKNPTGKISLFENKIFKEVIHISSNQILVNDSEVIIKPTLPFALGKNIEVLIDTCFINKYNINNDSVKLGMWVFTITEIPKIVKTFPLHKSVNNTPNTQIDLMFNKQVHFEPNTYVFIYQNDVPFDTLSIANKIANQESNSVVLKSNKTFALGSKVSVSMAGNVFKDNFNLFAEKLDTSEFYFFIQETSNVINIEKQSLTLFPNPSDGKLYLESPIEINSLKLYDSHGKLVLKLNPNMREFDFIDLNGGNYFILVNESIGLRFIKF